MSATRSRAAWPATPSNLIGNSGRRDDNSIHYYSGEVNGASAAASYSAGEISRDPSRNRAWGISVGYERGPLTIRAAHQNRNVASIAPATPMGNNMDAKNSIIAANVRVGIATAYAAYSANRGTGSSPLWNPDNPYGASMATTPSTDSRDVLVGLARAGRPHHLARLVHPQERPRPGQPGRQPGRARRHLRAVDAAPISMRPIRASPTATAPATRSAMPRRAAVARRR